MINYSTGEIIAYEVLARWLNEDKWHSPPKDFNLQNNPNSEMQHLSNMMEKVKDNITLHPQIFNDIHYLSFNLNANNTDSRVLALCLDLMASGYKGKIVLEINESQKISKNAALSRLFSELNAVGVMLALDDFGHGYLSFSALIEFNVSIIKLDKSLTSNVLDCKGKTIITHINKMAKQLGLTLIAEGVETYEVAEALSAINISHMQGFFFARAGQF
ncbi:EAL domain-containing protein [Serratia sp. L9]|uniref:EAL domain-containing protein n=1 Tax=Serratia sp. L9 TaxID=3423946 RepID=UPI003D670327